MLIRIWREVEDKATHTVRVIDMRVLDVDDSTGERTMKTVRRKGIAATSGLTRGPKRVYVPAWWER